MEEVSLPGEVDTVTDHLRQTDCAIEPISLEAGTMSQVLFHSLIAERFDTVCMETRQVATTLSAMQNKTDKADARGIAQTLQAGWYTSVHMKKAG